MKIEPRGKFGGIKVHLDPQETQDLVGFAENMNKHGGYHAPTLTIKTNAVPFVFAETLRQKVTKLLLKFPDLYEDKSPEKVKEELQLEIKKSTLKLGEMANGIKWDPKKGIKVNLA